MNESRRRLLASAALALTAGSWPRPALADPVAVPRYSGPEPVVILDYADHAMEPDVSSDGQILLWNNSNARTSLTDLHWARRVDDTTFDYQGPLAEANAQGVLDATPSMTNDLLLFYVSLRDPRRGTLYWMQLGAGALTAASPVPIERPEWQSVQLGPEPLPGPGTPLYFTWHKTKGLFEPGPPEMGIGIADWNGSRYVLREHPEATLPGVNTDEFREYAAGISADHLEFYFTRWAGPGELPQIWMAVRASTAEPFGHPVHLSKLTGLVEAATLTADGKLYFHKRVGDRFVIMLARRR